MATKRMTLQQRVNHLRHELDHLYPNPSCSLRYSNPLELLIATILSAQCTDARVNIVTKDLFQKFRTVEDYAKTPLSKLEELIRSTGFYRNKAKNIQACCRMLLEKFNGKVPRTLDELAALPGVGRKTANVVLGDAFGIPGITVDTHVGRLSRRLGLTNHTDPVKVERDLMKLIPQSEWTRFSHQLILHGRQVCASRRPRCEVCTLSPICPKQGVTHARIMTADETPS
jgi:endonuclease-3